MTYRTAWPLPVLGAGGVQIGRPGDSAFYLGLDWFVLGVLTTGALFVPLERASKTQPFPTKPAPFAMQSFTVDDVNPYIANPVERDSIVRIVREAFNLGLYTPPSLRPTRHR